MATIQQNIETFKTNLVARGFTLEQINLSFKFMSQLKNAHSDAESSFKIVQNNIPTYKNILLYLKANPTVLTTKQTAHIKYSLRQIFNIPGQYLKNETIDFILNPEFKLAPYPVGQSSTATPTLDIEI